MLEFTLILPEIFLISITLLGQLAAVFCKHTSVIIHFIIISLLGLIVGILYYQPTTSLLFSGSFEVSAFIYLYKALILGLTIMSIVIYQSLMTISNKSIKMEFVTLMLLATTGIFISISARDFVLLFCALELQALPSYAMAAFNQKDVKSSEAGLKYFILGALISCLMLIGISFLYGFSGSVNFNDIRFALNNGFTISLAVGAIFVLAAILFKLSAAPLHIWTPDVYEGAPISAVTYFSVAQKMGMLIVLINFVTIVVIDYIKISIDLIKITAILSIFVGALGAIGQSSLKRLMAYSTILNMGYVLIGICLHSNNGIYASFLYLLVYVIGAMGFFACLVALFGSRSNEASFDDLKGIASYRKTLALSISIIMFSMIGIPPLAGFFGKYYVFYNAVMQGEFVLALLGVLTSVVAAFYYLKIVKYMYFMEADSEITIIPTNYGLLILSIISVGFTLIFFILAPGNLI